MRLIAIREHYYPQQTRRKVNDEYEATKGDGVILIAAKLAQSASEYVSEVKFDRNAIARAHQPHAVEYEVKEENAEPLPTEKPVRKKRQYKRRDMNPQ